MEIKENQNANEEQDLIATLGQIYGVAEVRKSGAEMVGAPVLVSEQALVFFAWQEGEV